MKMTNKIFNAKFTIIGAHSGASITWLHLIDESGKKYEMTQLSYRRYRSLSKTKDGDPIEGEWTIVLRGDSETVYPAHIPVTWPWEWRDEIPPKCEFGTYMEVKNVEYSREPKEGFVRNEYDMFRKIEYYCPICEELEKKWSIKNDKM
jgi:hypothetical protein